MALRVSTLRQHRDGYVTNFYDNSKLEGYNEHAERIQLLYKPSTTFDALFNVHQRTTTGSARVFRANAIAKGSNDLGPGYTENAVYTDGKNFQSLQTGGGSARLSWNLGEYKLSSITGFEQVGHYLTRGDIDGGVPSFVAGTPAQYGSRFDVETGGGLSDLKQYTQEFRIESQYAGPLNWQAGAYYFDEDAQGYSDGFNSTTGAQTTHVASEQKNKAYAGYASASYAVNDAFTVRGGVRYTKDKKDFATVSAVGITTPSPNSVSESKNKATWDLSGAYKLTNDVNAYARVATGFRAPSIAAASTDGTIPITVADAETITSYEAGIKADLFNKRARVAFSIYDYTVKNQQLTVVGGTSNVTKLINAKKTDGRGAEVDFEGFITNQFKVTAGGSYNFTKIKDPSLYLTACGTCTMTDPSIVSNGTTLYSINGNALPQAPKWIVNATARYGIPVGDGEMFVYTDWSYRSKINFFLYESTEFTGRSLLEGGLRVGYLWDAGKYEVAAFGRNITNTTRVTGAIDFNNLTGFTNEPRMWGVQFKGNF
jgi:iron complex outermembrane receptor protein